MFYLYILFVVCDCLEVSKYNQSLFHLFVIKGLLNYMYDYQEIARW